MASLQNPIELPGEPSDKVQHMIAFAVLALLGAQAYPRRLMALLIGLSAFGALIELVHLIPSLKRTADWTDLAAEIITTAAVLGVIFMVRRLRARPKRFTREALIR
ncbi:VanZ family protein [Allopontixanthobacter confluentis]|uniref:hypothetical protein n=1 Tax=Allopontixanthobacter confluentis TaxID=1849021 RepID=UPI00192632F6|nr:hypothetical protein [Allopontixanthobacter confluentis]